MTDNNLLEIINNFNKYGKIRKVLTSLCYLFIISAIMLYISNIFNKNSKIRIINKFKDTETLKAEKIMEKPRLTIKSDNGDLYNISANKAYHLSDEEITMEEVLATSTNAKISAGELKISEGGNRLIFSKNPVLIFKQ
jgi:hypothetical protein